MTTPSPALPKIIADICIVSRHGVCIFDLQQVANAAKELGLPVLAELTEREKDNSTGGDYYKAIKSLYGAA